MENIMVKKSKPTEPSDDHDLAQAVRASVHEIWQAGLGAFSKAQEEGGKMFSKLVKEGSELQKRTQKNTEEKMYDATDAASKVATRVSKQASDSWDKLERMFEERVSRALASLGVPTQKDIAALNARIDVLQHLVANLTAKKMAAQKPATKRVASQAIDKKPFKRAAEGK
jgi:poly(hydroxyalkanoate) granule-associated protein